MEDDIKMSYEQILKNFNKILSFKEDGQEGEKHMEYHLKIKDRDIFNDNCGFYKSISDEFELFAKSNCLKNISQIQREFYTSFQMFYSILTNKHFNVKFEDTSFKVFLNFLIESMIKIPDICYINQIYKDFNIMMNLLNFKNLNLKEIFSDIIKEEQQKIEEAIKRKLEERKRLRLITFNNILNLVLKKDALLSNKEKCVKEYIDFSKSSTIISDDVINYLNSLTVEGLLQLIDTFKQSKNVYELSNKYQIFFQETINENIIYKL